MGENHCTLENVGSWRWEGALPGSFHSTLHVHTWNLRSVCMTRGRSTRLCTPVTESAVRALRFRVGSSLPCIPNGPPCTWLLREGGIHWTCTWLSWEPCSLEARPVAVGEHIKDTKCAGLCKCGWKLCRELAYFCPDSFVCVAFPHSQFLCYRIV